MEESTRQATRHWTSAQPAVAAYVASMVRDRHDREDVLQETALAVMGSFGSYDPTRPFQAWAVGVARNQIRLYLRRRGRDRLVFGDETMATLGSTFENAMPPEELDYLPGCIDQLEGRARELCDLRYQDGLKPAAISKKVGMTANTVAKALQRIREQLRACIKLSLAREGGAR
ncbi:MAG: sigma-70 family RNA polymerase sigma factor [Verrucomicrobiales bacterium]